LGFCGFHYRAIAWCLFSIASAFAAACVARKKRELEVLTPTPAAAPIFSRLAI
jgi:hypothetical protein